MSFDPCDRLLEPNSVVTFLNDQVGAQTFLAASETNWATHVSLAVDRCLLTTGPKEFRNECALPHPLAYARRLLGETS